MDTNWSVEAAEDDPVIVIPWSDAEGVVRFIDPRTHPDLLHQLPEAIAWPEIRSALQVLNAETSSVWTAKCDAWMLSNGEKMLDFGTVLHGFGSYFDVIPHDLEHFSSLPRQTAVVQKLASEARKLPPEDARVDFILRPASLMEKAGYAATVYVYGYGDEEQTARENWSQALSNGMGLTTHWAT
jgi:hypothetical protein